MTTIAIIVAVQAAAVATVLLARAYLRRRRSSSPTSTSPAPSPPSPFTVRLYSSGYWNNATATPSHAAGDQLVCTIDGKGVGGAAVSQRLIPIGQCATVEDREKWLAAWRALGGAAQGLGWVNDAGEWVSYEPR